MMWMGEHLVDYGRILSPASARKRLMEVTSSAVQRAARDFFQPQHANLALVSPADDVRSLTSLLGRL